MAANVLRHERFQHVPVQLQKRRRGRLPRGVSNIKHYSRLKVGALAEIVGLTKGGEGNGKPVRIIGFDSRDACCFEIQSLDGPLLCDSGERHTKIWMKPANLRRVWTGLSTTERIKLRLWRGTP